MLSIREWRKRATLAGGHKGPSEKEADICERVRNISRRYVGWVRPNSCFAKPWPCLAHASRIYVCARPTPNRQASQPRLISQPVSQSVSQSVGRSNGEAQLGEQTDFRNRCYWPTGLWLRPTVETKPRRRLHAYTVSSYVDVPARYPGCAL